MSTVITSGIAQRIVRDKSAFELIALIEGAAANKQFMTNLQVINQQRQLLGKARADEQRLPKNAKADERAKLAKIISDLEARVTLNMQFMTKNYGYSVSHNYLLVPVRAALLKKAVDGAGNTLEDEEISERVSELNSSEEYDQLQALRAKYSALKAGKAGKGAKETDAEELRKELFTRFNFDVDSHYILQILKGALYASVNN